MLGPRMDKLDVAKQEMARVNIDIFNNRLIKMNVNE